MDKYKLNQKWILWYHSIKNDKWDITSYDKLLILQNLFDYQIINEYFKKNYYYNGMFFIIKENINPIWEDPNNRLGGCISFKYGNNILKEFLKLLLLCITHNLSTEENINEINGLSISPKKEFNIVKIWTKNYDKNHNEIVKEYEPFIKLDLHPVKMVIPEICKYRNVKQQQCTIPLLVKIKEYNYGKRYSWRTRKTLKGLL